VAGRRGLTLIELMAALAVLAVLAMLAAPSVAALAQRQRLAAAAESLASDLAEARMEAARSGQRMHLQARLPAGGSWCWVVATTAACHCDEAPPPGGLAAPLPGCALRQVQAADHPGIRLLQPLQARFEPQGAAAAVQAELQSAHGERLRVTLGTLGRAHVCVPAGGQPSGAGSRRYPAC
jgi:type IV fimbrial biogenesis protein FimT